jgi:hypothetical protein
MVVQGLNVGASKYVSLSVAIARGSKDKPLWLSGSENYDLKVVQSKDIPVVLFDTLDRRAWLVDGTTALLHLTCAQLQLDEHGMWDPQVTKNFRYASILDAGGAMSALRDKNNRILELRKESAWWDELEIGENNEVITKRKGKTTSFRVEDLVLENWTKLSMIWERQSTPSLGLNIKTCFGQHLEGWSFTEMVSQAPKLIPQTFKLGSAVTGWTELTNTINACVLMSSGFGEIIRPSAAAIPCERWSSMPTHQDLLAVMGGMLQDIHYRYLTPDMSPKDILPGLRWHQPHKLFEPYTCAEVSSHPLGADCIRVQQLSSKKHWGASRCQTRLWRDLPSQSAVIFGSYKFNASDKKSSDTVQSSARTHLTRAESQDLYTASTLSKSASSETGAPLFIPSASLTLSSSSLVFSNEGSSATQSSFPTTVSDHRCLKHHPQAKTPRDQASTTPLLNSDESSRTSGSKLPLGVSLAETTVAYDTQCPGFRLIRPCHACTDDQEDDQPSEDSASTTEYYECEDA